MQLLKDLVSGSEQPLSTSSKFMILNSVIYFTAGLLILFWPGAVQTLFFEADFVGREAGLIQVAGMTLLIIGWFYLFGGHSGARQFVASTVVDRITFVPLLLIIIASQGTFPNLLLAFAVLDPALGLIAWYLLEQEKA